MNQTITKNSASAALIVVFALMVVAGGVLYWSGISPWLLFFLVFTLSFLASLRWLSPGLALSLVTLGNLALYAVLLQLYAFLPGSLAAKNFVALGAEAVAGIVILSRGTMSVIVSKITRNKPLFVTGIALSIGFALQCVAGSVNILWAMNNDAVWNTISARFLVQDGGLNAAVHPNPSSLTAGIMAATFAPGRETIPTANLLLHDITREAQMWSAVILLTGLMAGLIVAVSLRTATPLMKWLGTIFISALPLTWYFSGYAVNLGFYNASLAILILFALWVAWQRIDENPGVAALLFSLAAIATLATWAPLVLIPLLFIPALVWRMWPELRSRPTQLVLPVAGVVTMFGYASVVTLRDVSQNSGALAVDGAIFDLQPLQFSLILILALLLTFMSRTVAAGKTEFLGALLVGISACAGIAYLAFQRRDSDSMWGYYPIKFAWLISCLLVVIIFAALVMWISHHPSSHVSKVIFLGAGAALTLSLMAQSGLPSVKTFFTPVSVLSQGQGSYKRVIELSMLAQPGKKNIVLQYGPDSDFDLAFNNWLLQVNSDTSEDPIRWYSYFLNGTDTAMACEAIEKWGSGVVVHTRNPQLSSELGAVCPSVLVEVRVHD